jgi:hypothetical protein
MPCNLNVHIVSKEPVAIKKDPCHEDTVGLEQRESIPEDIRVRGLQLVFEDCPYGVVYGVPEAQKQIRSLPDLWYVVKNFQPLIFVTKLSNEKQKLCAAVPLCAPLNIQMRR